jgi:SnoaL-like protein
MNDSATLMAIESIKLLKAQYCRLLDAKDWAGWRELFSDDFVSDISGGGGPVLADANDFVAYTRRAIGKPSQLTVHQVHNPEIVIESETAAHGVWALNDVVRMVPAVTLKGYGHYHERYAKYEGAWRITSLKLTRLREDVATPVLTFCNAKRLRAAAMAVARRTS